MAEQFSMVQKILLYAAVMAGIRGCSQARVPASPKTERRVTTSHEMDWVRACKESPESRLMTKSDFSEAGPFNEMVVMGVLAVRLQGLNKTLVWDGEKMDVHKYH